MTGPQPLVTAVRKEIDDLHRSDKVIVACSGGPDSIALAAATLQCRPHSSVVVVDHGLQPDSAQIAAHAAATCADLGYLQVDVVRVDLSGEGGLEAQARRARYAALQDQAKEQQARAVLLGHTMEDQAETVLLGLTRGSGPRALAGMPRRRGLYRRPFLGLRRHVVRGAFPDIPVWEDPHNVDRRFRRSLVRHEVLPVMAGVLGDSVVPALARSAELLRMETDALDYWADSLVTQHVQHGGTTVVQCGPLQGLPQAVVARVLLIAAEKSGCRRGALTAVHVTALTDLVLRWRGQGQVDLPGGVVAARISGTVEFGHQGRIR